MGCIICCCCLFAFPYIDLGVCAIHCLQFLLLDLFYEYDFNVLSHLFSWLVLCYTVLHILSIRYQSYCISCIQVNRQHHWSTNEGHNTLHGVGTNLNTIEYNHGWQREAGKGKNNQLSTSQLQPLLEKWPSTGHAVTGSVSLCKLQFTHFEWTLTTLLVRLTLAPYWISFLTIPIFSFLAAIMSAVSWVP